MYRLVIDSSDEKLEKELTDSLDRAGVHPSVYPFQGQPMLRCPDRRWIHGRKRILEFADKLRSQTSARP